MTPAIYLTGVAILAFVSFTVHRLNTTPLNDIPGPFLAKYSNVWRFVRALLGRTAFHQHALHQKYGVAVRIGPNIVSINDPSLIKVIFSTKERWVKVSVDSERRAIRSVLIPSQTSTYSLSDVRVGSNYEPHLFSVRDEAVHSRMSKPIARLWMINNLLRSEGLVDTTISTLTGKLDDFARKGVTCPVDKWLHYCKKE